jgi:putative transposase
MVNSKQPPQKHRPPHLHLNNQDYFITIATYKRQSVIDSDNKKKIVFSVLRQSLKSEEFDLIAWVILDNHIHLLIRVADSKKLSRFIARLTGKSAIEINKLDNKQGRKIWYQYWNRCIRNEKDFYTRLNYIHYNPVKHDYAADTKSYAFSSYHKYLTQYGDDWLNDCYKQYPVKDFTPEEGMELTE